jgi:DNA-binding response OmpR family regulator
VSAPTSTARAPAVKRVLLVEDEERLRGVLARFLRARGHTVREARTAAEAEVALDRDAAQVLLLDVNLPDRTGWDVLRWMRGRDPDWRRPCVVVLSATPPSPKRLAQFTPDAVLNKPFPIDALGRLVETECRPEQAASDAFSEGRALPYG